MLNDLSPRRLAYPATLYILLGLATKDWNERGSERKLWNFHCENRIQDVFFRRFSATAFTVTWWFSVVHSLCLRSNGFGLLTLWCPEFFYTCDAQEGSFWPLNPTHIFLPVSNLSNGFNEVFARKEEQKEIGQLEHKNVRRLRQLNVSFMRRI